MWKKKEAKKQKKKEQEPSLLKALCGSDAQLYDFLRFYLYETPLTAISKKDLDILTEEAERSGNFGPAVDKAIFEGAQNPEDRERYIRVIQDLASKTVHATEQEEVEKEGFTAQAASLGRRIEHLKFMSERTADILNVASEFYNEKLMEVGEHVRREARGVERKATERDERRIGEAEKAARQARREERKGMGREERREAKKQDRREELAAEERREARGVVRKEAERDEEKTGVAEEAARQARREERKGN